MGSKIKNLCLKKGNQVLTYALGYMGNQISSDSAAVAVFNMQLWERTDVVVEEFEKVPNTSFNIVNANGKDVPFQVLSQDDGRVSVLIEACQVPLMRYTVYKLVAGKHDSSTPFIVYDGSIKNDFFEVRFDGQRMISGIYDKKNDRQVIEEGKQGLRFDIKPFKVRTFKLYFDQGIWVI